MTYKEIQSNYKIRFGKTVKSCWIADYKRKNGLKVRISSRRLNIDCVKYECPDYVKQNLNEMKIFKQ